MIRLTLSIAAAGLLVGCGSDEAVQPADFCGDEQPQCAGENTLRVCQGSRWQVVTCSARCGEGRRSQGCLRLIDRGDECACSGARSKE